MHRSTWIAALLLSAAAPIVAKPLMTVSPIAAAVADSASRTADNVKLDDSRKPGEVLRFLGLRPGMRVLDPFGANLYWAEISAPAVGPKGRVSIWEPRQFYDQKTYDRFTTFKAAHPNAWLRVSPFEAPDFPANAYDFALINLDYHDVYWTSEKRGIPKMDPDAWLTSLYGAMKPGGIVGVIDHVAAPGDTRATVEKLHRIDPATVKADFKRAGFKLEAESRMLANPADDHSLLVFDPAIRGHTDRFVLKFRKVR